MRDTRFINNDWSKWNADHKGISGDLHPSEVAGRKARAAELAGDISDTGMQKKYGGDGAPTPASHLAASVKGSVKPKNKTKGTIGGSIKGALGGAIGGGIAGSYVGAPGPGAAMGAIAGGLLGARKGYKDATRNQYRDPRFIYND